MAWSYPFRWRTPSTRTCWGYTFELTNDHLTPKETGPLKQSYDKLAEQCLEVLDRISPPDRNSLPRNSTSQYGPKIASLHTAGAAEEAKVTPPRDLYAVLRDHHEEDPKLSKLWAEVNTIPEWVDWDQIARGQEVFYRYGGACITGLAYQSLLGGMGAARVVETLGRTGGFSTKVARRRLFETTQHILQCTRSLASIQPGGEGFASTLRVRLLHAAVRRRIMKLAEKREGYFNVPEWGVPINDLDSIATIGTFSSTLIWIALPRQGIFLRKQEIIDYIALWRYIGYLVGCPTDPYFVTPRKAKAVMETLLSTEIDPTDMSKLLANNIIRSLEDQPPGYASSDMLVACARWLNGHELCDRLGLSRPGLYYYILVAGQCLFFIAFCYTYRSFPSLDRRKNEAIKAIFYKIVVESKYGLQGEETMFDFKYIPEYHTITEQTNEGQRQKMRNVEWRNLKAFVLGIAAISLVSYAGFYTARGTFRLAMSVGVTL